MRNDSDSLKHGFLFKYIRSDEYDFWPEFVEELLGTSKAKVPRRQQVKRKPFTIRLREGRALSVDFETEIVANNKKKPRLTAEQKKTLSKAQSFTYTNPTAKYYPPEALPDDKNLTRVGVRCKNGFIQRIMLGDIGTFLRPYDHYSYAKANAWVKGKIEDHRWHTSLDSLIRDGKSFPYYTNEVMARISLRDVDAILIFAPNTQTRLFAQIRQRDFKRATRIHLKILHYNSAMEDYSIGAQELDLRQPGLFAEFLNCEKADFENITAEQWVSFSSLLRFLSEATKKLAYRKSKEAELQTAFSRLSTPSSYFNFISALPRKKQAAYLKIKIYNPLKTIPTEKKDALAIIKFIELLKFSLENEELTENDIKFFLCAEFGSYIPWLIKNKPSVDAKYIEAWLFILKRFPQYINCVDDNNYTFLMAAVYFCEDRHKAEEAIKLGASLKLESSFEIYGNSENLSGLQLIARKMPEKLDYFCAYEFLRLLLGEYDPAIELTLATIPWGIFVKRPISEEIKKLAYQAIAPERIHKAFNDIKTRRSYFDFINALPSKEKAQYLKIKTYNPLASIEEPLSDEEKLENTNFINLLKTLFDQGELSEEDIRFFLSEQSHLHIADLMKNKFSHELKISLLLFILIRLPSHINCVNSQGNTFIMTAVYNGCSLDTIQKAMAMGATLEKRNRFSFPSIRYDAEVESLTVIELAERTNQKKVRDYLQAYQFFRFLGLKDTDIQDISKKEKEFFIKFKDRPISEEMKEIAYRAVGEEKINTASQSIKTPDAYFNFISALPRLEQATFLKKQTYNPLASPWDLAANLKVLDFIKLLHTLYKNNLLTSQEVKFFLDDQFQQNVGKLIYSVSSQLLLPPTWLFILTHYPQFIESLNNDGCTLLLAASSHIDYKNEVIEALKMGANIYAKKSGLTSLQVAEKYAPETANFLRVYGFANLVGADHAQIEKEIYPQLSSRERSEQPLSEKTKQKICTIIGRQKIEIAFSSAIKHILIYFKFINQLPLEEKIYFLKQRTHNPLVRLTSHDLQPNKGVALKLLKFIKLLKSLSDNGQLDEEDVKFFLNKDFGTVVLLLIQQHKDPKDNDPIWLFILHNYPEHINARDSYYTSFLATAIRYGDDTEKAKQLLAMNADIDASIIRDAKEKKPKLVIHLISRAYWNKLPPCSIAQPLPISVSAKELSQLINPNRQLVSRSNVIQLLLAPIASNESSSFVDEKNEETTPETAALKQPHISFIEDAQILYEISKTRAIPSKFSGFLKSFFAQYSKDFFNEKISPHLNWAALDFDFLCFIKDYIDPPVLLRKAVSTSNEKNIKIAIKLTPTLSAEQVRIFSKENSEWITPSIVECFFHKSIVFNDLDLFIFSLENMNQEALKKLLLEASINPYVIWETMSYGQFIALTTILMNHIDQNRIARSDLEYCFGSRMFKTTSKQMFNGPWPSTDGNFWKLFISNKYNSNLGIESSKDSQQITEKRQMINLLSQFEAVDAPKALETPQNSQRCIQMSNFYHQRKSKDPYHALLFEFFLISMVNAANANSKALTGVDSPSLPHRHSQARRFFTDIAMCASVFGILYRLAYLAFYNQKISWGSFFLSSNQSKTHTQMACEKFASQITVKCS